MQNKKELRQWIRTQKSMLSQEERLHQSATIVEMILQHPRIVSAQVVMAYCSLSDEVDTTNLLTQLLSKGKRVLLPKVINDYEMKLCEIHSMNDLTEGAFHIMEPNGWAFVDYDLIEVAIIPGMAFDHKGHRLGRGRGYYDRFLAQAPNIYKIGVSFSFQKVASVPVENNDIIMDEII